MPSIRTRSSARTQSTRPSSPSKARRWLSKAQKPARPRKKASHLFYLRKLGDGAKRIKNLARITTPNPMKTRNMTKKRRGRGYPPDYRGVGSPIQSHPLALNGAGTKIKRVQGAPHLDLEM